jgi:NACalpha-BTF3-like transcription factor
MAKTSYQHLTDSELIKYAMIDALPGSLPYLLAERYEANAVAVKEMEEEHAAEIEALEADTKFIEAQDTRCADRDKRIEALENEIGEMADAHAMEIEDLQDRMLLS